MAKKIEELKTFVHELQTDPKLYLSLHIKILRLMALLPNFRDWEIWRLILCLVFGALEMTVLTGTVVTQFLDIYYNSGDMRSITTNLVISSLMFSTWYRILAITYHRKRFDKVLDTIDDEFLTRCFPHTPQEVNMSRWLRIARIQSFAYSSYSVMVATNWSFQPLLFNGRFEREVNGTIVLEEVWNFPSSAWYPFDAYQKYIFPLLYMFQSWGLIIGGMFAVTTDCTFVCIIYLVCGQLEILEDAIRHVTKVKVTAQKFSDFNIKMIKGNQMNKMLGQVVRHHNMLLTIVEDMETIFWSPWMVDFIVLLILLSCCIFEALMATEGGHMLRIINLLSIYFACTSHMLMLCTCGQKLVEQVSDREKIKQIQELKIAEAAYESEWYDCPKTTTKCLRIIMTRAEIPKKLTVGKIAGLNLDTFSDLISRSFSFFTVLRQVKSEN